MKERRIEGGPAYPQPIATDLEGNIHSAIQKSPSEAGMSLRDYFAGQASDSVVAMMVKEYWRIVETNCPEEWSEDNMRHSEYHCNQLATIEARYRLAFADAMIAEREKGGD